MAPEAPTDRDYSSTVSFLSVPICSLIFSFLSSFSFLCLFHMTANGQEILESHACFLSLACDDLIVTAVMKRHEERKAVRLRARRQEH